MTRSHIRPHATAAVLAALTLTLLACPAVAADSKSPRLLTVSGEGEATAAPDRAELSAGVVSEARTAAAALTANSAQMNAVFSALKKMGIPDKSIETTGFSVAPQYPPYNSTEQRHITGYQVSNSVTVKVDDLAKLGTTLDALVRSGANDVNSVAFSIRDPKPLLAGAREAAVKDAMTKAETYAKAAGVKLGPVVSITEGGMERAQPLAMRALAAPLPSQPPPMAPGEQTVSANVTMSWEIQ